MFVRHIQISKNNDMNNATQQRRTNSNIDGNSSNNSNTQQQTSNNNKQQTTANSKYQTANNNKTNNNKQNSKQRTTNNEQTNNTHPLTGIPPAVVGQHKPGSHPGRDAVGGPRFPRRPKVRKRVTVPIPPGDNNDTPDSYGVPACP